MTRAARLLSLARFAVRYELGMWRSLARWILRRPVPVEPGATTFGSSGVVTPILVAFIALSAVEVPILHLILPWPVVQKISLALGAYGLFWMIGLMASLRVHRHVVGPSGLRIRNGVLLDFTLPWEAIADLRPRFRSMAGGRSVRVEPTATGAIQHIGIGHQTSVDVVFHQPTRVRLTRGESEPVTELRFYADDPHALVAAARVHLAAEPPKADRVAAPPR